MSAAARPHKPSAPEKPDTCPRCGQDYEFRLRSRIDLHSIAGFRHNHRGWSYVHLRAEPPEAWP